MATLSKQHGYISGRDVAARIAAGKPLITMDAADVQQYPALARVGVGFDGNYLQQAAKAWAMDDVQGGVFNAGIPTPVQFLQAFLPGFVRAAFAPRKIDELVGIATVGNWHDEEVVQGRLETMGDAVPYGDSSNVPLSSWNAGFERRTIVRFEKGMKVGRLESARAGAMRLDSAAEKRTAAQMALDIARNQLGFVGYNGGNNRTYGLLNDPALPAYVSVAAGTGGTTWATKTYLEITADIRKAFYDLQVQSNGVVESRPVRARGLKPPETGRATSMDGSRPVRARGLKPPQPLRCLAHRGSRPVRARGLKPVLGLRLCVLACRAPCGRVD